MSEILITDELITTLFGDLQKNIIGVIYILNENIKVFVNLIKKYNSLDNSEFINKEIINNIIEKWENCKGDLNAIFLLANKSDVKTIDLSILKSFFVYKSSFDLFILLYKNKIKDKISFDASDLLNKEEIFVCKNENTISKSLFEEKSIEMAEKLINEKTILILAINDFINYINDLNNTIIKTFINAYSSYQIEETEKKKEK